MIERLLEPEFEDVSKLIWDVYGQFYDGFPIANLRPLITSPSEEVLRRGAFLANELGWKVRALTQEIAALLDCSNSGIRFYAIGALTACTTPEDGEVLGKLLQHLEDPDSGVRWRMVEFVRLAGSKQFSAAIKNAALQRPDSIYTEISKVIRWSMPVSEAQVRGLANHSDPGVRLLAAGIALRPRKIIDEKFAEIVLEAGEPELSDLISRAFQHHAIPVDAEFGRVEKSRLKD